MSVNVGIQRFDLDLKKFSKQVDKDAESLFRKVVLLVFRGVRQKTPVRTGHARSNWQISVNTERWAETAGSADAAAASLATGVVGGLDIGDTAYVLNGLPYIEVLERGGVNREAHAMVSLTLAEVKNRAKQGAL